MPRLEGRVAIVTGGANAHMYTAEYNTAKEASRALARTAAHEWAHLGIRVNVICPAAATEAYKAF